MLQRLVRVLVCLLVLLACVPDASGAHAFLSLLTPQKPLPPVVGHFSSRIGVPHAWRGSTRKAVPRFQRFIRASDDVTAKTSTALVTATDSNMAAALNPRDGGIVWRREFPSAIANIVGHEDHVVVLTGTNGTTASILHAKVGSLLRAVELRPGTVDAGNATDVAFFPASEASDFIALAGGVVQRVTRGEIDWRWQPDAPVDLQHVVIGPEHIHVAALTRGKRRPQIFTLTRRGALVDASTIPSDAVGDIIVLPWTPRPHFPAARYATADGGAHVAWVGTDGNVHAALIDAENPSAHRVRIKARSGRFARLIDVGLGDRGYFVAERKDYSAEALQVDAGGRLLSVWEFDDAAPEAVYDGTFDRAADAYISRITFTRSQQLLSLHFLWADAVVGSDRGQLSGMSFQFDHDMHGNVLASPFEVSRLGPHMLATRVALVTSSGSMQMFLNGEPRWRLEQGLAETTCAALVDLPDSGLGPAAVSRRFAHAGHSDSALDTLEHEGFVHRMIRHAAMLARVPVVLWRAASSLQISRERLSQILFDTRRRLRRGLQPTAGGTISRDANATAVLKAARIAANVSLEGLYHDHFGFRKVVVAGTRRGRLYGIDQSLEASAMLWERSVAGYGGGEGEPEPEVEITHIVQTRPAGTLVDGVPVPPLVAVFAQIGMPGGPKTTHVYDFNPLTGESDDADGAKIVDRPASVHVLPISAPEAERVLGVLADDGTALALHPNGTIDARVHLAAAAHGVSGYAVDASTHAVRRTWHIALAPTERVVAEIDQSRDHVASLGRVRGDRSVMYKWLNPHARLVVTHDEHAAMARAYVIDTVSGEVVHEVALPHVVPDHGVKATFAENWITIHYSTSAAAEGSDKQPAAPPIPNAVPNLSWQDDRGAGKTRRLVSIELYEPAAPTNASVSSFGQDAPAGAVVPRARPVAHMRSFLLPYAVRALGTSRTALGVATRTLVVVTDRENVVVIPRRMLDPLRTTGRPPPADAAVGIMAYAPEIPDELSWRVSPRELRIMGLDTVTAAPSLLESTSMVLATGVDWFYTSVSPSGQFDRLQASFNKTQLVLTIAVLFIAIAATRPLMRLRTVGRRW